MHPEVMESKASLLHCVLVVGLKIWCGASALFESILHTAVHTELSGRCRDALRSMSGSISCRFQEAFTPGVGQIAGRLRQDVGPSSGYFWEPFREDFVQE